MKYYMSIILPTTRIGGLDILFNSLELQTFKDFELILVDSLYDRRKDLIAQKSTEYSFPLKHLPQVNTGTDLCKGLNSALISAEGYLMYILPDYTWIKSDCLQIHADFHKKFKPEEKCALVGHFYDCELPQLHKDFYRPYASNVPFYREKPNNFLEEERKNYANYMADLDSGRLNNLMWSLFETPFTTSTDLSLFKVSIPKDKLPKGPVSNRQVVFKNESYVLDTIIEMNGFNEACDGSHGWQDWEFVDRLTTTTNTKLYYDPDAVIYTINPRPILYARNRKRDVFSNEAIWQEGVNTNFKNRVNSYSLRDKRENKAPASKIIHTKKTYISVICPTMRIGGLDTLFNSLEHQTFKDFELIISDSLYQYRKDIVAEMGKKYSFKYKHIAPINDKFPIFSQAHSVNSAIVQAEGEVILFTTDYRYFMPWTLQKHVDFHRTQPDNVGYAPGSKFLIPPPMKDGIPSYGRNTDYNKYIEDLKAGKLQDYMWSIFENDIFATPQDLSTWTEIDRLKVGYDPKTDVPFGSEVSPQQIFTQSESLKTKIVLEANGMNEAFDGAFNYMDIEFAYRLRSMFDLKWIGDNTNTIYRITGGDRIISKGQILENAQASAEAIYKKYEAGSKDPVNDWSLAQVRSANQRKHNIVSINTTESVQEYFGRSFKIVDWHLLPGNNGTDNPWDDEAPIREQYWNYFQPGQVIIDVGACFGLYTLPALMQGCRVLAFEPNDELSDVMSRSVKMNNFAGKYNRYDVCLWNDTPFPEELIKPILQWCKKDKLNFTTLNDVTRYLDRVDMIKIDVEGAEAGVLAGAHETIRNHRPSFLIEDHTGLYSYPDLNNTRAAMLAVLDQYKYSVKVELFGGPPPPDGGRWFIIATPQK